MLKFGKISIILSLLLLTACGFQPLYAKKQEQDSGILQKVQIDYMADREGQILRNRLIDILNPYGQPAKADYVLSADIRISSASLGVRSNATTVRRNSTVQVIFKLKGPKETREFSIVRKAGYGESVNAYATDVAEEDAIRRNLEEIAEDAKTRIAAILKRNS